MVCHIWFQLSLFEITYLVDSIQTWISTNFEVSTFEVCLHLDPNLQVLMLLYRNNLSIFFKIVSILLSCDSSESLGIQTIKWNEQL